MTPASRAVQGGVSLIELMIALSIGLLVVGAATTAMVASSRSSQAGVALAELQGRARIALDELALGIRSAGYIGCAGSIGALPAIPLRQAVAGSAPTDWQPVNGFSVSAGSWSPAHPVGYRAPLSGPGVPVAGSDALLLEGGARRGVPLADTLSDVSRIEIGSAYPGLERGALGLIADCSKAEGFHIESTAAIADGAVALTMRAPLGNRFTIDPRHPSSVRVMPYRRALYYVGETTRQTGRGEPVRALYEHLHPFQDTTPVELASGVEALVIRYRQRAPGGGVSERGAVDVGFDPERIIGVRLALLISAPAHVEGQDAPDRFQLAGVSVRAGATSGAIGFPDDERIRRVFERTETVRNRDARQVR